MHLFILIEIEVSIPAEHSRQQRPNWSGICCKQRSEGIAGNLDIVLLIRIP